MKGKLTPTSFAISRDTDREHEISADVRLSDAFIIDLRSPLVSLASFGLDGTGYEECTMTVDKRGTMGDFLDNWVSS